jgi:outer membrane protein OmpA-like peptidoglycan-associated protein
LLNILNDRGVSYPGIQPKSTPLAASLAYIEQPKVKEEIAVVTTPAVEVENSVSESKPKEKPVEKAKPAKIANNKIIEYPNSASTNLPKSAQDYLDEVAKYIKDNPGVEVRITGHSDILGTPDQNEQRATDRATKARKYLIDKGIPSGKVLAFGRGSREPKDSRNSMDAQKKNRRIEIQIVPSK